ncbi:hypothetical protein GVN16_14215 [Emticicia sp. CRIBPO]|uniref:hypothetical protein n=1 Tax=Emticicia sp. CRIBPO TaxID=2683258 RepID=UPI001412CE8B|nr:hypothetical protein [Emticicia sp. CRIBPO]NBA86923.1 hypothetical protein [Emticicia sp. CRIBPO]
MENPDIDDKIQKFWRWFVKNDELIRKALEHGTEANKEHLVRIFDNKVLEIGTFTWDIEPGFYKQYSFTISPNRSRELLKLSRKLISYSPELTHWEFKYCRPAENWDLTFGIYDEKLAYREIDASGWRFMLLPDPGQTVSITLEAENLSEIDEETCLEAAEIVVTGLLGEESRIIHVTDIGLTRRFGTEFEEIARPVTELKQRVEQILGF